MAKATTAVQFISGNIVHVEGTIRDLRQKIDGADEGWVSLDSASDRIEARPWAIISLKESRLQSAASGRRAKEGRRRATVKAAPALERGVR